MVTRTVARAGMPIAAASLALLLSGCAGSGEVNTIATTPSSLIVQAIPTTTALITVPGATTTTVVPAVDPAAPVTVTTLQANVVTATSRAGGTTATTKPAATSSGVSASGTYKVQAGDSLYAIAQSNGVKLQDLLAVNGFTVESQIRPGDVIKLPGGTFSGPAPGATSTTVKPTATTTKPAANGTYTVKAGDSLYGIAQRAGVRLSDLLALNGLTAESAIQPGDVIKLPAGAITAPATGTTVKGAPAPSGTTYEIKQGDTLFGIAQRFGVSLKDLLAANGFTTSTVITPGTRIKIPQS